MHGKNAKESALQVSWNARITKYAGLISFRISVYEKHRGGNPAPLCPRKQMPKHVNTHADITHERRRRRARPARADIFRPRIGEGLPDLWTSRLPDFPTSLLPNLPTPPPCRCTCGTPVLRSH